MHGQSSRSSSTCFRKRGGSREETRTTACSQEAPSCRGGEAEPLISTPSSGQSTTSRPLVADKRGTPRANEVCSTASSSYGSTWRESSSSTRPARSSTGADCLRDIRGDSSQASAGRLTPTDHHLLPLHSLPASWMRKFHSQLASLEVSTCITCLERSPGMTTRHTAAGTVCIRCHRDTHSPKAYSKENNMHPGTVPMELVVVLIVALCKVLMVTLLILSCHLQGLTQVEEMLQ